MAVGSIIIKHNPVTAWEQYVLTVSPMDVLGLRAGEAKFSDYQPQDRSEGGNWGMKFKLHARENLLKEMFEQGLGRHVEAWGDGLQQDFEGYIHEMTYNLPPDRFTMSLENMVNKIWMRTDYDDDGSVERSTTLTDADSDARYGTKELVLAGGETEGLTVADQAVQTFLDLRAWPRPEAALGTGRGDEYLEIFCRGYIHTLGWRVYNQTVDTGTQGMNAQVQDILDDVGEFVDSYSLDTNATTVTKEYDADRKALDILMDLARLGDASNNRWIIYMKGRNATSVIGREFILKQAAPAVVPGA